MVDLMLQHPCPEAVQIVFSFKRTWSDATPPKTIAPSTAPATPNATPNPNALGPTDHADSSLSISSVPAKEISCYWLLRGELRKS